MYEVKDSNTVYGNVATLEEALELAEDFNAEVFDENGELVEVAPY